jgi:hypothetical protein
MVYNKTLWQLVLLAVATAATVYTVAPWVRAKSERSAGANMAMVASATPNKGRSVASETRPTEVAPKHDETLAPAARSRVVPETKGEAFANLSWLPPPPPVVIVPPPRPPKPPPPTAPTLPFAFVGLMEKGTARPQAFLTKGDALLVVAAGDTIDNNTYRIESLSAQKIVLTYLPMATQQTLNILGAKQ